jgi:hypothetical protein
VMNLAAVPADFSPDTKLATSSSWYLIRWRIWHRCQCFGIFSYCLIDITDRSQRKVCPKEISFKSRGTPVGVLVPTLLSFCIFSHVIETLFFYDSHIRFKPCESVWPAENSVGYFTLKIFRTWMITCLLICKQLFFQESVHFLIHTVISSVPWD